MKKTIREEIEKYNKEKGEGSKSESILPVNASPATPKGKKKSKARQTERRLSNLLEKIRSKNCIRGSAKSSSKKMKRLQAKYERFDPISKTYKLVRQKDGGGPRFIDVYAEDTILFNPATVGGGEVKSTNFEHKIFRKYFLSGWRRHHFQKC